MDFTFDNKNNKQIKPTTWTYLFEVTRHYLYIITYLTAIIVYSVNYCFPFYVLKKIKSLNEFCKRVLQIMLVKFQSVVKCSMFIGGIDLYVYTKKGTNLVFGDNAVIISNHLSELDSMFLGALYTDIFPSCYKIITFAKDAIRFYPFIGWITLAHDTIFVQNRNKVPNKGQYNYIETKLQEENNNEFKKNIIIFIEGTTFDKRVKKQRELFNGESLNVSYNNVLIPKTTGLHMIHSNVDINGEIYVTLRFEGNYEIEEYTMSSLLCGKKPSSVHMIVDTQPYVKDMGLLNNREKYNEIVYEKFKSIDAKLDDDTNTWNEKYNSTKLSLQFMDILYFVLFLISGYYMYCGILYSWLYRFYIIGVSLAYVHFGNKELINPIHGNNNNNNMKI